MAEPLVDTTHPLTAPDDAKPPVGAPRAPRSGTASRHAEAWLGRLQEHAGAFEFFQAARVIDCAHPHLPRLGEAKRAGDEPVRLGQPASLAFAVSSIDRFDPPTADRRGQLRVNCFGLLGPNGPLPIHLTEFARHRELHEGDRTFGRFLDVFHHRMLALFYRAWAVHQQTVSHDRPTGDHFARYVGSLIGIGTDAMRHRDAVDDLAKFHYAGRLSHRAKNASGLSAILGDYFGTPFAVEEFVVRHLRIAVPDRARLGRQREATTIGEGLALGSRVVDVQHGFRLHNGPLDWAAFCNLLPGGKSLRRLRDWVRNYVNVEFQYDLRLTLRASDVKPASLGGTPRPGHLGWSTWLTSRPSIVDRSDLTLDVERYA